MNQGGGARSLDELVLHQLAAQGVAVDAEPFGRARLVAFGAQHDHFEHGSLHGVDNHVVHRVGLCPAQVMEVALQVVFDAVFEAPATKFLESLMQS